MDINIIKDAAIKEILSPTFEVTKQLLSVNTLIIQDGLPIIEDVIYNTKENYVTVYFSVFEEDYYFVIYIDYSDALEIRNVGTSPGNKVYFAATSERHDLNELINFIEFKPTKQWNKGDKRKGSGEYSFSAIFYQENTKKTGEVEEKLERLTDFLLMNRDKINELSKIATLEIRIAYFGYKEEMWGFHFNNEIIKKISMLYIDIDIDLYAGGSDLPDEY